MIASVDIVDTSVGGALKALVRAPKTDGVPGLRMARTMLCAPLALSGPPPVRRVGLVGFWDDEAAIDAAADTELLRSFAGGLHARLRPLRAHGSWPGLPADVPSERTVDHDGPVVVVTLGHQYLSRTVRFLRTSRPAEKSALESDGFVWGTAAVRPPFACTVSIWRDSESTKRYAFGRKRPEHSQAIAEQDRKDFHRQSAFVRFEPLRLEGRLAGKNPIDLAAVEL